MWISYELRPDGYYNIVVSLLWYREKFYHWSVVWFDDATSLITKIQHKITQSTAYQWLNSQLRPAYQDKLDTCINHNISNIILKSEISIDQYVLQFVYNSNRSEGSRISQEDFDTIIQQKKSKHNNNNEIIEVQNSQKAIQFLMKWWVRNTASIKKIYHILTKWLVQDNGLPYPRWWKRINNIVGNDTTTDHAMVAQRMEQLIQRYRENKKALFPLQLAIEFYYRFEKIHPFLDGNGRVGRMLMNKIMMQYDMIPITIFAENNTAHRLAFEKSSPDYLVPIYEFVIDQYVKTLKLS